mgnify:CR=1 FL=1|jgi:ribonuclease I
MFFSNQLPRLALQKWCSSEYKIHGLWLDYDTTSYPSYCSDVPFDFEELQKSKKYTQILENWYDCTIEDTISLYEHEWSKHGTCVEMQTGFTQNEFFEKTLELFDTYKGLNQDTVCFDLNFTMIDCTNESLF